MSQEHVEVLERIWATWEGGALDDAARETLHPEVELMGAVGGIEEGAVTRGREAVSQAMLVDPEV